MTSITKDMVAALIFAALLFKFFFDFSFMFTYPLVSSKNFFSLSFIEMDLFCFQIKKSPIRSKEQLEYL